MSEIYSYCNEETTHIIEEECRPIFPDCDTMILPCRIGIYEVPDDEEIDVAPVGERIGNIEGWQVLWLSYFEGFSNREAAQIMDFPNHNAERLSF